MDFQKNKFLIIIVGVIVLEILVYFWWSSSYAGGIASELTKIESTAKQLDKITNTPVSQLKNEKWVKYYRERKQKLLQEWTQCVDFYAKRDVDFEKYFPNLGTNFDRSSFWLRYGTRWKDLVEKMKKAALRFDKEEDQDKDRGFFKLKKQPADNTEQERGQKGFWIQEVLVDNMIKHKVTKFYETKLSFQPTPVPKVNPQKFEFTPPFHLIEVQVTFAIPYHRLNLFLADLLQHNYMNFTIKYMNVSKQKFEVRYQTITSEGSEKKYQSGELSFFDRCYFHLNLHTKDFQGASRAALEGKYLPSPSVKVHLRLHVLDYDKKLLIDVAKALSAGPAKGPAKARRRRRRR